MKKIVFFLAVMACVTASKAQFVLGVQGGYYYQKNAVSTSDDFTTSTNTVGCLQLGYMVTPELYVGLTGGYISASFDTMVATPHQYFYPPVGMNIDVKDHMKSASRSGWLVAPQVRYEFLRYGNMHFNLLLQGQLRMLGAVDFTESYTSVSYPNPNEYREEEPYDNNISYTGIGISLRPTLIYEFSRHLSAELVLDLLSIGFVSETETFGVTATNPTEWSAKRSIFYAGLNSLNESLRWENTMLKLGFNYTF
jgi:hypothetical protein